MFPHPRRLLVSCWKECVRCSAWQLLGEEHRGGGYLCFQGSAPLYLVTQCPCLPPKNAWPTYGSQATCYVFQSSGTSPLDVCQSGEETVGWSKQLVGTASKAVFFPLSSLCPYPSPNPSSILLRSLRPLASFLPCWFEIRSPLLACRPLS